MSSDKKSNKKSQGGANKGNEKAVVAAAAADPTIIEDNACVVCFKSVEIFSIGECDHPVCFECSTRMRVLCEQNECPICRAVISKVIFTYEKLPFRELEARNRSEFYSKKYKIGFCSSEIQQRFFELLDHPCPKCNCPPYRTFQGLRNHVRKEHDHYFCDLCVENLKIFTFERRCYTQAELGIHRTKGDPDNRSHRGHPLCEYCNKRFLDRDELFRHLRREHYFCHFCDADGCNEFYRDYAALAQHFRQDHFLCEEGKCATEEFTGAFRTEIDYKCHVSNVHGQGMNKQQAKQTRTLQLEITLGPRGRSGQVQQGIANMRSRAGGNESPQEDEENDYPQPPVQRQNINPGSEQEFPSLAGATNAPALSLTRAPPANIVNRSRASGLARTKENFPALGGSTSTPTSVNSGGSAFGAAKGSVGGSSSVGGGSDSGGGSGTGSGSGGGGSVPVMSHQAFPPISAPLKKQPSHVTGAIPRTTTPSNMPSNSSGMFIHVSNRPANSTNTVTAKKPTTSDFPALPMGKTKKGKAALLNEDLPTSSVQLPVSSVSAKHRILVDDYVSVANPANFQKIQMVQKEEFEAKARKEAEARSAPKLNTHNFPTLGGNSNNTPSNPAPANTWLKAVVNERKQKELENRKNKVAPAPILPKSNNSSSTAKQPSVITNGNTSNQSASSKKENKKPKEKKTKEPNNNSSNGNYNNENKSNSSLANSISGNNNNSINRNNKPEQEMAMSLPRESNDSVPTPEYHSNVIVNSVAKSPNSLTFTSSLGECYSILPTHTFTPPTDALLRNQRLIYVFRDILKSMEALEEFRHISQMFRDNIVNADSYYEHCQAALGEKFDVVFPELLALLPDIYKQQALFLVHQQRLNGLTPAERQSLISMDVCNTCKQVLLPSDVASHQKMHDIVQNFPELNVNRKSTTKA